MFDRFKIPQIDNHLRPRFLTMMVLIGLLGIGDSACLNPVVVNDPLTVSTPTTLPTITTIVMTEYSGSSVYTAVTYTVGVSTVPVVCSMTNFTCEFTITGTNFSTDFTVVMSSGNTSLTPQCQYLNSTTLVCNDISTYSGNSNLGTFTVSVINPDGQTATIPNVIGNSL